MVPQKCEARTIFLMKIYKIKVIGGDISQSLNNNLRGSGIRQSEENENLSNEKDKFERNCDSAV